MLYVLTAIFASTLLWADPFLSQNKCTLSKRCPETEVRCDWAQKAVDGDLMLEELRRMKIPDGNVKIAVIDTGFDLEHGRKFIANRWFDVAKGHIEAGDPSIDQEGHGTMVTSLIGGKGEILGLAPNARLTVYRFDDGKGLAQPLLAAEQACNDGNDVVNISGVSQQDESGDYPLEVDREFQNIRSKECIVINSSGNRAYASRDMRNNDPEDNLIRISGLSSIGGSSVYATPAELDFPGDQIPVLKSKTLSEKKKKEFKKNSVCGSSDYSWVFGTSFSAPLASSITAQIVSVLKTSDAYLALEKSEKIKLVNRILKASARLRMPSGLRAVLIAKYWFQQKTSQVPSAHELSEGFEQTQVSQCLPRKSSCASLDQCDALSACIDDLRRRISLCPGPPADAYEDLIQVLVAHNEIHEAARRVDELKGVVRPSDTIYLRALDLVSDALEAKLRSSKLSFNDKIFYYAAYRRLFETVPTDIRQAFESMVFRAFFPKKINDINLGLIELLSRYGLLDSRFLWRALKDTHADSLTAQLIIEALVYSEFKPDPDGGLLIAARNLSGDSSFVLGWAAKQIALMPRKVPTADIYFESLLRPTKSKGTDLELRKTLVRAIQSSIRPISNANKILVGVLESGEVDRDLISAITNTLVRSRVQSVDPKIVLKALAGLQIADPRLSNTTAAAIIVLMVHGNILQTGSTEIFRVLMSKPKPPVVFLEALVGLIRKADWQKKNPKECALVLKMMIDSPLISRQTKQNARALLSEMK